MSVRGLLAELGIPFAEHTASSHVTRGWVGIVCPLPGCGQGGKFGRGINLRTHKTTCWKCGPARLGEVLSLASGHPLAEILARLPRRGDELPAPERPRGRFRPPAGVEPLSGPHKRYLAGRGFDPDQIAAVWGVGALGPFSEHPWRLYIPVARGGVPVTWTTRAIGRDGLRYRAADPADEAVPLHDTLYGWDHVRHAAVVVEGPTDAWRIGPGAVATFGVGVTAAQTALLSGVPVRVVAFDNDPAARRRAERLADDLAVWGGETYLVRLTGKDPDTSPPEEIAELRARFLDADVPGGVAPAGRARVV